MVLEQQKENVGHAHQVLNCALGSLTRGDSRLDSNHYLGPFSVEEEQKDLSKDFLRLEVNFGEVLEEKKENSALVDFLSQLRL